MEFIKDIAVGDNRGKIYKVDGEYKVFHEKENPTMGEKLELLTCAAEVIAELQGITVEAQLTYSNI